MDGLESLTVQHTGDLLAAATIALTELLSAEDFQGAVFRALGTVGEAARVHRVKVILQENESATEPHHKLRYEWWAPHLQSQASYGLQYFPDKDTDQDYLLPLKAGRSVWKLIEDVSPAFREPFERAGVKSMGVVPIFAGGAYAGMMAFDDCVTRRRFTAEEISALTIAANAIGAAICRRQLEVRAAQHARSLARAKDALQASIDELSAPRALEKLTSGVLKIIGDTFGARACGFFEHRANESAILRQWYMDGRVLGPFEVDLPEGPLRATLMKLATGFPASHLNGTTARGRTRAIVIDHRIANTIPEFHSFAVAHGWDLELNQPLIMGGRAEGALCIYRAANQPFTAPELELADSLAKQLAMAIRASGLAKRVREAAVAREREQAAREKADLLETSNAAIRGSLDRLSRESRPEALLEGLLLESMRVIGAIGGSVALWENGRFGGFHKVAIRNRMLSRAEIDAELFFRETGAVLARDPDGFTSRLFGAPFTREDLEWARQNWPTAAEYHERVGHREVWNVPCVLRGELVATLGLGFSCRREPDPVLVGTLTALAQQVTLVLEMTRLSDLVKQAAVDQERARADKERAITLEHMNRALRQTAERLSTATDPAAVIIEVLRSAAEVLSPQGVGGVGWVQYLPSDNTLRMSAYIVNGQRVNIPELAGPVDADSPTMAIPWRRIQDEDFIWGLTSDATVLVPEARAIQEGLGARAVAYIPLRRGRWTSGFIGFNLRSDLPLTSPQIDSLQALAGQLALAVEVERLADEAKEAVIARERERSTQERLNELRQSTEAISTSLVRLAADPTAEAAPGAIVLELSRQLGADACYWFDYDPIANTLEAALRIEKHIVLTERPAGEPALFDQPFDADITPAFRYMCQTDDFVLMTHEEQNDLFWPGCVEWHRRLGRTESLAFAVRIGSAPLGVLGIAFVNLPELAESQKTLIRAMSSQLALAVHLTKSQAKARVQAVEAAVAREREKAALQQADQARRVNQFLIDVVGNLAAGDDFGPALESIVSGLARALGAAHVFLFRHDPANGTLRLELSHVDGRIRWGPCGDELRLWAAPFSDAITPAWKEMTQHRGLFTPGIATISAEEFAWPGALEYARKHSDVGHIVLFAGDVAVGSIGLALNGGRKIDAHVKAIVESVAQHAAVALRLVDLAELSRQAAVLRERADAEKARMTELKRAHAALQRVQDRLARDTDLQSLVGHILEEICVHLETPVGGVFLTEPEREIHRLLVSFSDGRTSREIPDFPWFKSEGCVSSDNDFSRELERTRDVVVFEPLGKGPQCDPGSSSWLAQAGFRLVANFPLIVGEELLGFLGVAAVSTDIPPSSKMQFAKSMSQQMSLAIQIERLSEKARQAAVLSERGRIAGDIHDSLAQSFAAISMQLEAAEEALVSNDAREVQSIVARAKELARFGLSEARRSIMTMRPAQFLQKGLAHALEVLVERCSVAGVLACSFEALGVPQQLDGAMELELFRIAQEAVSNAIRHGRPTVIAIRLSFANSTVTLWVRDDGQGMTARKDLSSGGLASIRQRVEKMKGKFELESSPGCGTTVSVSVNSGECRL